MSKNFTLNQLTEGIRQRHLGAQNARLVEKWSRTGLLRGLEGTTRENMAMMLENQAAQLLRESNTISTGLGAVADQGAIRGFSSVAFPIVRRVFGGLVANELVSIQPMSLPSGLLFYLDYTYGSRVGGTAAKGETYSAGQSIYNNPAGKGVRSGSLAVGGQYDLAGSGYSRVHKSFNLGALDFFSSGSYGDSGSTLVEGQSATVSGSDGKAMQFDPQLSNLITDFETAKTKTGSWSFVIVDVDDANFPNGDLTMIKDWTLYQQTVGTSGDVIVGLDGNDQLRVLPETLQGGKNLLNLKRLNQLGVYTAASDTFEVNPLAAAGDTGVAVRMVVSGTQSSKKASIFSVSYPLGSALQQDGDGSTLTIPAFEHRTADGDAINPTIPEIDIKIESIAVTAVTRKLKAKWSPELAQDLNAYHSLDAEVELTQILSEQIALELDREILNDLLTQANGANLYWSRAPGKFVNKESGAEVSRNTSLTPGPAFSGTVREWYETLTETIIDCANTIHRKTLRGSANFIVVSPDVATILEASVLYRPSYSLDGDGQVGAPFNLGADKVGTLSNRFTVYKDPYFPRNKILVGYKGGSYLETGYVYAPYVPLIVTPTIFQPEDFTPRKGVMTRYGKKMVRSDFYGTVTVLDLNII